MPRCGRLLTACASPEPLCDGHHSGAGFEPCSITPWTGCGPVMSSSSSGRATRAMPAGAVSWLPSLSFGASRGDRGREPSPIRRRSGRPACDLGALGPRRSRQASQPRWAASMCRSPAAASRCAPEMRCSPTIAASWCWRRKLWRASPTSRLPIRRRKATGSPNCGPAEPQDLVDIAGMIAARAAADAKHG